MLFFKSFSRLFVVYLNGQINIRFIKILDITLRVNNILIGNQFILCQCTILLYIHKK